MNLQEYPENRKQQKQKNSKFSDAISLLQRKHYGCLSKIFCCKCFYCCQDFDFTLLTSKNRKGAFQNMVKKYLKSMHNSSESKSNVIMDPFFMLVALLLGQESQIYNQLLQQVSNSNQKTIFSKQDLQFYIPQLCTYLVFHQEMSNIELTTLLQRACKIDLHFSLRYYFFMKSLQKIDSTYQIKRLPIVEKYNANFRNKINLCHKVKFLKVNNNNKRKGSLQNKVDAVSDDDYKQTQIEKSIYALRGSEKQKKQQTKKQSQQRQQIQRKDSFSSTSSSTTQCDEEILDENQKQLKICKNYNIKHEIQITPSQKVKRLHIEQVYESLIAQNKENYPKGLFESTANFFNDFVCLSEILVKVQGDINKQFQKYLDKINEKLPATVYIPFTKNDYHGLNIVNVVVKQSRVFKTKERAPFKICFETFYNPNFNDQSRRQKKIRSTIHSSKNLKRSVLFEQDIFLEVQGQNEHEKQKTSLEAIEQKMNISRSTANQKLSSESSGGLSEVSKLNIDFKSLKKNIWQKVFQLKKFISENDQSSKQKSYKYKGNKTPNTSMEKQPQRLQQQGQNNIENASNITEKFQERSQAQSQQKSNIGNEKLILENNHETTFQVTQLQQGHDNKTFGQSQQDRFTDIVIKSPYSKLPGYKIVNLIVKSNDDLRQECFAMQLLQQFERIFKMQKLKIILCPYEVVPLSHNSGIIQFISQAITIDELLKKQQNLLFVRKSKSKLKNFIRSLAGYSLVTYMLQVKDRHNQNIMIKRDGTIVHIDYGFFLSSMPGKGVQLQKKVPFKLTIQYIDALGGLKSKEFNQYRKLFYQGFNALRKHQHRILILTKLMYSSYGTTMRCFEKGDQAIQKFVSRFNPKNVRTDGQLSLFCQNLINSSIQNWRAKWYDRWQYFAQGILY